MSKNINIQSELFTEVNSELAVFINALICKLEYEQYQSDALNRKSISQLSGKIYKLLNDKTGNQKQPQQNRDIFLKVIESHLTNFINNQIIIKLIRCADDYAFAALLAKFWTDYKKIVFSFFTLFIHTKDYYENARITQANKNKVISQNKQQTNTLPLPIPVLGVMLFNNLIMTRFQIRIKKTVLSLIKRERQSCQPSNNDLTLIFQIIWSCSLKQLARITISKQSIYFIKEQRKQFTIVFKQAANNEYFIANYILIEISRVAAEYYADLTQNLRLLNGIEQIQMINQKCQLQEQIARFHLPSKTSIDFYLNSIYRELIINDFDELLRKPMGFKHIISNFSHTSTQFQRQVQLYFKVIRRVQSATMDQVIKVVDSVISQRGAQIKEKLNKPRQFMTDMLHFKKSLRKIFAIVQTNTLKVEVAMQKGFKGLMQGYQVSKSLAEFTDYTIRQCSRLKLDQTSSEQKLKEVIFMLTSVSAKDLFLAYHQDSMAKRLLDCLNQPKLEPELLLLRLLAENLGNIMLNSHFSMIKDIQNSIDITENISKILPFINYKWDLKVINSSVWPDSTLKIRFSHISPPSILQQHLYQLQDLYKQYRGFTLQWKLDRGTSLFQGRFPKGKWRFQAENIYMVVLLHFNDLEKGSMTFKELSNIAVSQKRENEKNNHLEIVLKVLIENKLILRGQSRGPNDEFEPDENLQINMQYSPGQQIKPGQSVIIKMSQQLAKNLNQNNVEVNKIIKDREKLVDALLVKFLKHAHSTGNNRITFLQLYEGVKNNPYLSNFNFSQTAVKQRLEQLVSKEYCRRDEEDRRVYHYIA